MKKYRVFFEHDVTILRSCYCEAENKEELLSIIRDNEFNPFDYEQEDDEEELGGIDIRLREEFIECV